MNFLVDAQLPVRLTLLLDQAGHDAVHTSDLPDGNASTDAQVVEIADAQNRVVVTKDRDFRDGHLLKGSPRKLLIVATGNISNDALLKLFEVHLGAATSALDEADFVELRADLLSQASRGWGWTRHGNSAINASGLAWHGPRHERLAV